MRRKHLNERLAARVAFASRRRCCLCFGLLDIDEPRKGQVAHLNGDSGDDRFDNLVYLCLDHHDELDGTTSQSKGLISAEVRAHRDRLYRRYPDDAFVETSGAVELRPMPETSVFDRLRGRFPTQLGFTAEPWRNPLWQVANQPDFFAYKASNGCDGVCLVERIDLPDGRIAIVLVQTEGNPGQSITNSIESVCFQVCERFQLPAERVVWIEHYDVGGMSKEWHLVRFERQPPDHPFENPSWTRVTPQLWTSLALRPSTSVATDDPWGSKVEKLFPWPVATSR